MVVTQNTCHGLDHVLGFERLGGIEIVVILLKHQSGENQQHQDRNQQDQPQAAADRYVSQTDHEQLRENFMGNGCAA
ncbi:hypothetical protein D3C81_1591100 [compost metagenome]